VFCVRATSQVRVLDLEESVKFYKNVLGLVETGRDNQGRVYFKAWDERDHNSVILRQADRAGVDFFAFKVPTRPPWTSWKPTCGLRRDHRAHCRRRNAGNRRARALQDSDRPHHRALRREDRRRQRPALHQPGPWTPEPEHGIAPGPHGSLPALRPDIDGTRKLFEKVLGFYLVERVKLEDGKTDLATWLTCSHKAHDIALVRHGEDDKLHHVSLPARHLGKGAARGRHHVDEPRLDRHRPDPPRHHPRHDDLRLRSVGQPLRNLLRRLRVVSRTCKPITWTWEEVGPASSITTASSTTFLPERGDLMQVASAHIGRHLLCRGGANRRHCSCRRQQRHSRRGRRLEDQRAVVDAAATLMAFLRMPGAFLHSIDIAIDKAYTAASFGFPPRPGWRCDRPRRAAEAGLNQAAADVFGGGLPCVGVADWIGGIGVSGGSEAEAGRGMRARGWRRWAWASGSKDSERITVRQESHHATSAMKQFLNFINGEFVATGKTFENRNPATNAVIGHGARSRQAEVDAAVAAGRAALKGPGAR
jgi:uncharacterized protein GlcG (DUF336 family)/catechol 2,3-dioxygenase-like lactoylglutathione lyase family enzyme